MYKLLIVDDEQNILDGLAATVPWNEISAEVVGTAVDGMDAYDMIPVLKPDIVITDINMDNLNGLELTELIHQHYPMTRVVVLSGYDDFNFVSRALELKVTAYILKPINSEELIEAVRNAIFEIECEKKLEEKIRCMASEIDDYKSILVEKLLYELLNGTVEEDDLLDLRKDFLNIEFSRQFYTCSTISILDHFQLVKKSSMKKLQGILYGIRGIINDYMIGYELWTVTGGISNFTLIVGDNAENQSSFHSKLAVNLEKLTDAIYMHLGVSISVATGRIYRSILDISSSFREATLACEYNAASTNANVIFIDDLPALSTDHYSFPENKISLLMSSLVDESDVKIHVFVRELLENMEQLPERQIRINLVGLFAMISRRSMELGLDIYEIIPRDKLDPFAAMEHHRTREQMEEWLKGIILTLKREIQHQQDTSTKRMILKAILFLENNYENPYLSLTDVASHVFLNACYFGRLYKREKGESYTETLTRIRIDHAKTLLKNSNLRISEICDKIGYPSSRYFTAQFKKHVGFTPLEYRKS